MTVASTLVHRFYMRRSFKDFNEEVGVFEVGILGEY